MDVSLTCSFLFEINIPVLAVLADLRGLVLPTMRRKKRVTNTIAEVVVPSFATRALSIVFLFRPLG